MYPTATAPVVLNERRARPGGQGARPELREVPACCSASVERLSQGYSLGRGAGLFRATRAACCGATSPTTASCGGTRRPARPRVYRKPSNYANGNTRDRQGRLVTAEHGRRVTRTEYDGRITVLMDRFDGKRLSVAERRRGEVRRLDLVHRHDRRHRRQLERRDRRAGIAAARLPDRRQDRQGRRW